MTETYVFPPVLRAFLCAAPADAHALTIPNLDGATTSTVELPMSGDFDRFLRVVPEDGTSLRVYDVDLSRLHDPWTSTSGTDAMLLGTGLTIDQALRLCHDRRKESTGRTA